MAQVVWALKPWLNKYLRKYVNCVCSVRMCGSVCVCDIQRRERELRAKGLLYVGSGVSGGEDGARYGPSLMPGGSPEAWSDLLFCSVLWYCWLGGRKSIWPVKNWVVECWHGLCVWSKVHTCMMPQPLTVSCFSKVEIGFTFLVPVHPGSPGQRGIKWVCVCSVHFISMVLVKKSSINMIGD